MPGVGITRIDLGGTGGGLDVALGQVGQQVFTAAHVPNPPGSDNRQLRSQCRNGTFKTYLVVTLAGTTVSNGFGAFGQCRFGHGLGDDRASHGGTQQVGTFVDGAGGQGRIDVVVNKLVFQIGHDALDRTGSDGLGFDAFQLFGALAYIAHEGNDFTTFVVLFQPRNDGRSVQTARVGQQNFFELAH